MLFSKKLPFFKKKNKKNRTCKIFRFFRNNKKKLNFFKLRCLDYVRLFINHLKMIDLFLTKCTSKYRRLSRKEYYKKLNEKDNRAKLRFKLIKKIMKRSSTKKILKKEMSYKNSKVKKIYLRKYRRVHNTYLCFNHKKIPYSRKSNNSRMGKGNGLIKNWYLRFTSGKVLFFIKKWRTNAALKALNILKKYIPGRLIISVPTRGKIRAFSSNSVFII